MFIYVIEGGGKELLFPFFFNARYVYEWCMDGNDGEFIQIFFGAMDELLTHFHYYTNIVNI